MRHGAGGARVVHRVEADTHCRKGRPDQCRTVQAPAFDRGCGRQRKEENGEGRAEKADGLQRRQMLAEQEGAENRRRQRAETAHHRIDQRQVAPVHRPDEAELIHPVRHHRYRDQRQGTRRRHWEEGNERHDSQRHDHRHDHPSGQDVPAPLHDHIHSGHRYCGEQADNDGKEF